MHRHLFNAGSWIQKLYLFNDSHLLQFINSNKKQLINKQFIGIMGISCSQSMQLDRSFWKVVRIEHNRTILFNQRLNLHVQQHKTLLNESNRPSQLLIYQWRQQNTKQNYIQELYSFKIAPTKPEQSSHQQGIQLILYTELLQNIKYFSKYPQQKKIELLKQFVNAAKALSQKYGHFRINSQMLGINQCSVGKLWINSDIIKNYPEQSVTGAQNNIQLLMINDILSILRQEIDLRYTTTKTTFYELLEQLQSPVRFSKRRSGSMYKSQGYKKSLKKQFTNKGLNESYKRQKAKTFYDSQTTSKTSEGSLAKAPELIHMPKSIQKEIVSRHSYPHTHEPIVSANAEKKYNFKFNQIKRVIVRQNVENSLRKISTAIEKPKCQIKSNSKTTITLDSLAAKNVLAESIYRVNPIVQNTNFYEDAKNFVKENVKMVNSNILLLKKPKQQNLENALIEESIIIRGNQQL